jgi:lipid-binding SYLF domain-containing protein
MTRHTAVFRATQRVAIILFSMLLSFSAYAENSLDRRIDSATEVLEQFTRIPEQGIPANLLKNAYAVAVVPSFIKAGFLIAGAYGKGILVVRHPDGTWSNPSFISMGAGSFGWQAGAQSTDIILVFKNRKGVENIANGKLTLGADANVAAGPVGRSASAATDLQLSSEIYTYARNRGLFGGVSLEGGWVSMDAKANFAYYENGDAEAKAILSDPHIPTPAYARKFIDTLSAKAPALDWEVRGSRTASNDASNEEPQGATTYAIDDAPAATGTDEAVF